MANDINFSERIIKRIDGLSFDEKIVLLKKHGIIVKQSDIDRHKRSEDKSKQTETLVIKTAYKKKKQRKECQNLLQQVNLLRLREIFERRSKDKNLNAY